MTRSWLGHSRLGNSWLGHGRPVIIPIAVALVFALAGCGGGTAPEPTSPSSERSTSSPRVDSSPSASATASPSPSGSGTTGSICSSSQLTASLGQGNGAAGSVYVPIVLTNHGGTCTTQGFPGVSLTNGGRQIGAPAERDGASDPHPIILASGQSAHATLRIVQTGNFEASSCQPTKADHILVYPPDQKAALSITTDHYTGCANAKLPILTISALAAGNPTAS